VCVSLASGDFVNLEIFRFSPSKMFIGIWFICIVYVYRGQCMYVLWMSMLYCVIVKKKRRIETFLYSYHNIY
jgi:hypothetical protein